MFTLRGLIDLDCLALLFLAIVTLHLSYLLMWLQPLGPMVRSFTSFPSSQMSSRVPLAQIPGRRGPIDPDTPYLAVTRASLHDRSKLKLVFFDEFRDGRAFYPGDDPFCEAVNLHYWKTGNLEWYDPTAITTKNRALKMTLSKKETHDLNDQGSVVTSWNQFCFTGGYFEVGVTLPGLNRVAELWPVVWAMKNLGRAGHSVNLEGMRPYTYNTWFWDGFKSNLERRARCLPVSL